MIRLDVYTDFLMEKVEIEYGVMPDEWIDIARWLIKEIYAEVVYMPKNVYSRKFLEKVQRFFEMVGKAYEIDTVVLPISYFVIR